MQKPSYYREQAARARRLARGSRDDIEELLKHLASDFDDIAVDLERGAVEIRHPELMPQNRGEPQS
jgi:hypothetical protein